MNVGSKMKDFKKLWPLVALFSFLLIGTTIWSILPPADEVIDNPRAGVPLPKTHLNHSHLFSDSMATGPEVTAKCLECHQDAARHVMETNHWTWEKKKVKLDDRDSLVSIGKKHTINNYCISVKGNWDSCTKCHVGYGWEDEKFNFKDETKIDCLVCHDGSGMYRKGKAGLPLKGVDLLEVAKSVRNPTRENCGSCHFAGGGGNAVKHGDLDGGLTNPGHELDVHMGKNNMQCTDCHQTVNHQIPGRAMSISADTNKALDCTNCHTPKPHKSERLNGHTEKISCQACHIPRVAKEEATKTYWDWSKAGDSTRKEDHHKYLKIKGEFEYTKNLIPELYWYNGKADIYILGDKIDDSKTTAINLPHGNRNDKNAKLWPFKVHRGKQIYDVKNKILIPPTTSGEGGFWREFDWAKAAKLGAETAGLDYSGEYGFTSTEMYWPLSHMVSSKDKALSCTECHTSSLSKSDSFKPRIDWKALGYEGDPMFSTLPADAVGGTK